MAEQLYFLSHYDEGCELIVQKRLKPATSKVFRK